MNRETVLREKNRGPRWAMLAACCYGMMTVKDMYKAEAFPNAAKDVLGRLLVGAAVGTGAETAERVDLLVEAGVDVIIVDTAHGHSKGVIDSVAKIKTKYPDLQVIGGNIATAAAAIALADAGRRVLGEEYQPSY